MIHDNVILSRVFCGEGPMQFAGSTGATREFIGPSWQATPLRMTTYEDSQFPNPLFQKLYLPVSTTATLFTPLQAR
jgi:hypothetical protein